MNIQYLFLITLLLAGKSLRCAASDDIGKKTFTIPNEVVSFEDCFTHQEVLLPGEIFYHFIAVGFVWYDMQKKSKRMEGLAGYCSAPEKKLADELGEQIKLRIKDLYTKNQTTQNIINLDLLTQGFQALERKEVSDIFLAKKSSVHLFGFNNVSLAEPLAWFNVDEDTQALCLSGLIVPSHVEPLVADLNLICSTTSTMEERVSKLDEYTRALCEDEEVVHTAPIAVLDNETFKLFVAQKLCPQ